MPLIISSSDDTIIDPELHLASTDSLFVHFPTLKNDTEKVFNSESVTSFDSERESILYVLQGEMAIVTPQDDTNEIILTDDTTTCITGIIRHRSSGVTCLAHYDRPLEDDLFQQSLDRVLDKMASLSSGPTKSSNLDIDFDLYLIGGYCDERNISEELSTYLLTQFHQIDRYRINLACAFTGQLNTKWIRIGTRSLRSPNGIVCPAPIVYGAAVNVRTGQIVSATLNRQSGYTSGVPMYDIRRAAVTYGQAKSYKEIYDPVKKLLEVHPPLFDSVNSVEALSYFQYALRLRDQDILKKFSTSPYVEPEHFAADIRSVFQFFVTHHKKNISRLYFPSDKPRYFRHYRLLPSRVGGPSVNAANSGDQTNSSLSNSAAAVQYRWKEQSP